MLLFLSVGAIVTVLLLFCVKRWEDDKAVHFKKQKRFWHHVAKATKPLYHIKEKSLALKYKANANHNAHLDAHSEAVCNPTACHTNDKVLLLWQDMLLFEVHVWV